MTPCTLHLSGGHLCNAQTISEKKKSEHCGVFLTCGPSNRSYTLPPPTEYSEYKQKKSDDAHTTASEPLLLGAACVTRGTNPEKEQKLRRVSDAWTFESPLHIAATYRIQRIQAKKVTTRTPQLLSPCC